MFIWLCAAAVSYTHLYGIDLSKKRTLSECRLSAELEKEGITSLQQFMRRMEQDKTKRLENMMLDKLTTNYTFFMRESKHFDYLRENILPTLRPDNTGPFYRVWSAGCSTGEECYTPVSYTHLDVYKRQGCGPGGGVLYQWAEEREGPGRRRL